MVLNCGHNNCLCISLQPHCDLTMINHIFLIVRNIKDGNKITTVILNYVLFKMLNCNFFYLGWENEKFTEIEQETLIRCL